VGRTLVAKVSDDVDRNSDVVGDERLVLEGGHERIETLEDGERDGEEQRDVAEVRLEGGLVREGVSRDPLSLHGPEETDVRSQDRDPGEGSEDRDRRDKVVEDGQTVCEGRREVSQITLVPLILRELVTHQTMRRGKPIP
jgi:hypothetical protein